MRSPWGRRPAARGSASCLPARGLRRGRLLDRGGLCHGAGRAVRRQPLHLRRRPAQHDRAGLCPQRRPAAGLRRESRPRAGRRRRHRCQGPGGRILDQVDSPFGSFGAGDVLFTTGGVIPNGALLFPFGVRHDVGLDEVKLMGDPERIRRFAEAVRGTPPEKLVDGGLQQLLRSSTSTSGSRSRHRGGTRGAAAHRRRHPGRQRRGRAPQPRPVRGQHPGRRPDPRRRHGRRRLRGRPRPGPPDRRGPAALPDPVLDRDPLPGSATVQRRRRPPARRRHRDPPPDADQAVLPGDAIPGARRALPAKHRPRLAEHHAALRPSRGPVRRRTGLLQESRPRSDGTSTIVPRPCGMFVPVDGYLPPGASSASGSRTARSAIRSRRSARGRRSTRRGSSTIAATRPCPEPNPAHLLQTVGGWMDAATYLEAWGGGPSTDFCPNPGVRLGVWNTLALPPGPARPRP